MSVTAETISGIFITFSGNCRQAFTSYQACFGGELYIETFEQAVEGFSEKPVVKAVLNSPKLILYGSDLVHNEGRRTGNYMAVLVSCTSEQERLHYLEQLRVQQTNHQPLTNTGQALVEMVDRFDVRWVFAI